MKNETRKGKGKNQGVSQWKASDYCTECRGFQTPTKLRILLPMKLDKHQAVLAPKSPYCTESDRR